MHDVVLTQSHRVARLIMSTDWRWSPQRVKNALIISSMDQAFRASGLRSPSVYVAGDYPEEDGPRILALLERAGAVWGSPYEPPSRTERRGL